MPLSPGVRNAIKEYLESALLGGDLDAHLNSVTIKPHGAKTIDFGSISANSVSTDTITVPGAETGDHCIIAPPSGIEDDLVWVGVVTSADTVELRLLNPTSGAVDPVSGEWDIIVIK